MWSLALTLAASAAEPELLYAPEGLATAQAAPPRFAPLSPSVRCLVRVQVGPDGIPTDADAHDCPTSAATTMEQAILRWRWEVPRNEAGKPAAAAVIVPIAYTGRGSAPIAPASACTYRLEVASTTAIRVLGEEVAQ